MAKGSGGAGFAGLAVVCARARAPHDSTNASDRFIAQNCTSNPNTSWLLVDFAWWLSRICEILLELHSEDLQGGGVFSVVVGLYDDLHVLIEGDKEAQEAFH